MIDFYHPPTGYFKPRSPGDPTPEQSPAPEVVGKIHFHPEHFLKHIPGPAILAENIVAARAFAVGKYSLVRLPNGTLHVFDGVRGACPDEKRFEAMLEALLSKAPTHSLNTNK